MQNYPGTVDEHVLYYEKFPEQEYDPLGIPYGIQINYDRPFLDSKGQKRSVLVYRPSTLIPFLLAKAMIILCDHTDKTAIEHFMEEAGLIYLAERDKTFLVFALPSASGWNSASDPQKPDDVSIVFHLMKALRDGFLFPGREKCISYYIGMIGVGSGAEMAHVASAAHPEFTSCLLSFDGHISSEMLSKSNQDAQKFVWLVNAHGDAEKYWIKVNDLESVEEKLFGDTVIWCNALNHGKQVWITDNGKPGVNAGFVHRFWDYAFNHIVRVPGIGNGRVVSCSQIMDQYHPCVHKMDRSLGDNDGIAHNWLEFIPESVSKNRFQKGFLCPLIIVMHGGGCTPDSEIAVFNTHELGEAEGFITVYANASSRNSWNSTLLKERNSDLEFIVALIDYMIHSYPVNPAKVYLSGFSNGSGMSHVIAAVRPDLIAGIIAFNTRYPIEEIIYENAKIAKQNFDYRMPVFSTYGTLDAEYPMRPGCGQYKQMNFWKWFNNIEQQELNPNDPSGVGAPGDEIETWGPFGQAGEPIFTTHRYFCRDSERVNYFNYTIIEDLPHAVENRIMKKAWNFISRFSRMQDGKLKIDS